MAGSNSLIININGSAKDFLDEVDKVKKETESLEKVLSKTAKVSAAAFAGFAASIALATNEFAKYETALVGVGKTTDIEGKKLQSFGKQFQQLSSEIPVATNELLGIAQAAGQLGVSGEENLLKFTETVAKLGVATDLSGEEAATALTRILNVTKESISEIDTFGSVIVRLGNNFAATESEIVRSTTEVAGATSVFGVSSAEAAALGTALKSLGQQAQLGGSVVGKSFLTIQKVIDGGGVQLEKFAQLTGITGSQLKKTFQEDAAGVFQAFIQGLGNLEGGATAVFAALESFGLRGDEVNKVLPVLAKNADLVGDAFNQANEEVKNATALNREASKAFDTLQSDLQVLQNNATNAATNIGEQLAPAVSELVKATSSLLKEISELDKETLSSIASFLKWGAIITGATTAAATFVLGLIKARQILAGLRVAFSVGRIAAIGFTGALTGGLSIVLGFLPEIISGVKSLIGLLSEDNEPKTLQATIDKLDELKKKRIELEANAVTLADGTQNRSAKNLELIDKEIAKLEELKQAQRREDKDFGTGALLVKPTTNLDEFGLPKGEGLFNEDVTFPLKPKADLDKQDAAEKLRKAEEAKNKIVDAATQERINQAIRENENLKELQAARNEGLLQQDTEFIQKKQEIEEQRRQAELIQNEQERQLALENINLQNEEELAAIQEFNERKDELKATRLEEEQALDQALRESSVAQRDLFNQEDLQALQTQIDSEQEAKKKVATEDIQRRIKERNQFKKDEIQFGTEIANLKKFFNSQEVQGVKSTSAQLVQLTQSKNSTLKGIGKASARVNAAIATAEGAIKAYTSLSGIPLVGPVLGAAAAASLIAFGVEQQGKISAAQSGGFVPNSPGGARDRTIMALEPEELIVPKRLANPFVSAVGNPESGDFAGDDASAPTGGGSNESVIRLEGDLIQNEEFVAALSTRLREFQEFDNGRIA